MSGSGDTLIDEFQRRSLIAQMTGGGLLPHHLAESRVLYCGFDPTADSLHIGSLVPLLALRRFQLAGHTPITLVGGATGLIGDPSFKAQERQLNSTDVVVEWAERIRSQVSHFVDFDAGSCSARVVNNLEWIGDLSLLDFLRNIGKHFSVNAMIHKESVKQRIEREGNGISFTEFAYSLLQSYDFAELNRRYDCTLQIGGSDQWGNIVGGVDLSRRINRAQVFGLTLPLITKVDGTKFGKTEAGTVWLDATKTSPYAFYQFWMNTADEDVYRFLHYFTFLDLTDIGLIKSADQQVQGRKSAQGVLAREVTRLVHGPLGLAAAERISAALFSGAINTLTQGDLDQLALDGMPCSTIERSKPMLEILVDTGLAATPRGEVTLGQARKFVIDGAVAVNGETCRDTERMFTKENAIYQRFHVLRRGKKTFHLLRWI